ncbi:MAG: hypothetical protein RSE41_09070 [Clostridia bacterium]
MFNLKHIFQGFKNIIFKTKNEEKYKLYQYRYDICKNCENFSSKLYKCKICGCFCKAKVSVDYKLDDDNKSIEGCPLKKW